MKKVIIFRGPTAGGKSTIARILSDKLHFPLIDIDQIKHKISGSVHSPDYETIKSWFRAAGDEACKFLKECQEGVIIDEAFRDQELLNETLGQIDLKEYKRLVIEFKFPLEVHKERHNSKINKIHQDVNQVEKYYNEYERYSIMSPIRNDISINDPLLSKEQILDKILRSISEL